MVSRLLRTCVNGWHDVRGVRPGIRSVASCDVTTAPCGPLSRAHRAEGESPCAAQAMSGRSPTGRFADIPPRHPGGQSASAAARTFRLIIRKLRGSSGRGGNGGPGGAMEGTLHMAVSRRKFIASVAAGSALAAVSGTELVSALTGAAGAASPVGDVVGKITVGYQGWFACIGDGAPINGWWHWSAELVAGAVAEQQRHHARLAGHDANTPRSTRPRTRTSATAQPADAVLLLRPATVNTHFQWMQQNGCDTAALQRFNPNGSEGPTRDAMAAKVRTAAETYGRKFYIMYDVTGWTNMQSEIKTDWTSKMSAHTVVDGVREAERQAGRRASGASASTTRTTTWTAATNASTSSTGSRARAATSSAACPREWRTGVGGSRAGFLGVYHAFNMISPWMVGAIGNIARLRQRSTTKSTSATRPTATPTASTTSPACCPATSPAGSASTATSCGTSSTTWSASAPRASTSRCSTSTARATRSPRPPRPRRPYPTELRPARPRRGRHRLLQPTTTCASPATAAGCSRARSR